MSGSALDTICHWSFGVSSILLSHQRKNPTEGNLHPGGTVVELVAQFVDGLVQQKSVQQDLKLFSRRRKETAPARGLNIRFQENHGNPVIPELGPGFRAAAVCTQGSLCLHVKQGRVGRVVKRAQHAGDVFQCGPLEPPLAQRAGRLSFEIDDEEIFSRIEELAEMIVAMAPDTHGCYLAAQKRTVTLEDFRFQTGDLLR